jgi:hypothetical protein
MAFENESFMDPTEAVFRVGNVSIVLRHYALGMRLVPPYFYAEATWPGEPHLASWSEWSEWLRPLGFSVGCLSDNQLQVHSRGSRDLVDMSKAVERATLLGELIANIL